MSCSRALRSRVERAAARLWPAVSALGRDLHARPELSLKEVRSSRRLQRFLAGEGFTLRSGVAGLPTAFVARRRGRRDGGRVALLAEYDALPGIGHACGHNLIGAAAVGAAAAVGRVAEDIRGEIVVIGTPGEETIGGKALMAERGAFRGIDAALMFHPSGENRVYTTSLACHSLEVVFHGRAAHAVAAPERGIDALQALIRLFVEVERLVRSLPAGVRIPGVIVEGGLRANIVPDRAVGRFSLRSPDLRMLRRVEGRFRALVTRIARARGARASIRPLDHPYAEMLTNRTLADIFKRELRRLGRRTVDTPRRNMGSLDMGNVSQIVPAIHPYVAIAPRSVPLHSPAFARHAGGPGGRLGLRVATQALALTALQALCGDGTLERASAEFRGRRGAGRGRSSR
ncbi:MAG: amidohydrolase [Acidobacteriota bacterium]